MRTQALRMAVVFLLVFSGCRNKDQPEGQETDVPADSQAEGDADTDSDTDSDSDADSDADSDSDSDADTDTAGDCEQPDGDPGSPWIDFSVGWWNSCGVRGDGRVMCWGDDRLDATCPPDGLYSGVGVSSGACGIELGGTVVCWGDAAPESPEGEFVAIDGGTIFYCGVGSDGGASCWGVDAVAAPSRTDFIQVSGGTDHACGLLTDGSVTCWGSNRYGQTRAPQGNSFTKVCAGEYFSCALAQDGSVDCWGSYYSGANYDPGQDPEGTYRDVSCFWAVRCLVDDEGAADCGYHANDERRYVRAESGWSFGCGLTEEGTVHCWGDNSSGQTEVPD
ncbi:MAG: hypothetical protein H6741_29355 [Alphaproteobacteria bacterium]|nr:hypothetical protein [Alphaproteobacteria bacterium]